MGNRALRRVLAATIVMVGCSPSSARQPTPSPQVAASASPPSSTSVGITTTTPAPSTTVPPATTVPDPVLHRVPLADGVRFSYGRAHHDYPATDISAACGETVVAPVNGVLLEVRRVNAYDPAIDNPATRGGISISMLGDDGLRYYMAHFSAIEDGLEPGDRVALGQPLAKVGQTGRASGCHVHFGLSPTCPGPEWEVRRGVIWPWPYLDAWRYGATDKSPGLEIYAWTKDHPNGCDVAMFLPTAKDA